MKKILGIIFAALFVIGGIGILVWNHIYGENDKQPEYNTTVETLIQQDKKYFDNMAGKIIFYESQVVLDTAFNATDKFVAQQVTNVFQQELDTCCNVYEFKHVLNYSEVDIQVHKNTSWMEDCPVYTDSLKLCFDQAFQRAKQSDLIPSKSRYMTLRNPLGPHLCNPQYIIGNDDYGIMFIDGVTGNVSEKNPAFEK